MLVEKAAEDIISSGSKNCSNNTWKRMELTFIIRMVDV